MIESKLRVELTKTRATNNPFYGKMISNKVVEETLVLDFDKRKHNAPVGVCAGFALNDDNKLMVKVNRHYLDEDVSPNTYHTFFNLDEKVYELYAHIDGKQIINIALFEWLNYGDFEDGNEPYNEYKPVFCEPLEG